ncbi:Membrane-bound transcription factor site-2 protease [Halotydeus destructor]|nr:Membrane-bound transcription factor site-2 protease [Halotydeus destructor]
MLTALYIISVIWGVVLLLDVFFKIQLLAFGLSVKPFYLRWHTSRYSHMWSALTRPLGRFWDVWFHFGFLFTLFIIPAAVSLLIINLCNHLIASDRSPDSEVFQAVLPGVNIPTSELVYYVTALFIASILHEAGHAMAATRVNLRVDGIGLMVFAIIPAAFVELPTDLFNNLNAKDKLKVVCAGVWHNFVLAALCGLTLFANPVLLKPFFSVPHGVVIAGVNHPGVLTANGLKVSQVLEAVNECEIHSKKDWQTCLTALSVEPIQGYCADNLFIDLNQYHSLDPEKCCGDDNKKLLCFENTSHNNTSYCLPVRTLLDNKSKHCLSSSQCPEDSQCLRPSVDTPSTRLMYVKRSNGDQGDVTEDFLFLGFPGELYSGISVSSYLARFRWLPESLVYYQELSLQYTASFSLALGVLNAVPCYFLDGHWIAVAFIELLFQDRLHVWKRQMLGRLVSLFGTGLILSAILLAACQLGQNVYK